MAAHSSSKERPARRRWLITGGCGFIGSSLVRHLLKAEGHSIRIFDNLSVGQVSDLPNPDSWNVTDAGDHAAIGGPRTPLHIVVGDIRDGAALEAASRDIDIVVHLAANTGVAPSVENPGLDCTVNVIGTLNALEASRQNGVTRFVFASSGAPVGECEPPIHENVPPRPVSPYGASKLAGEGYCSAYWRTFGLETVALRFGNVYGPHSMRKESVIAKMIRNALSGEAIEIYGDGQQTRDFIFVADLLEAICAAAERNGVGGEIFQIATSSETTVAEVTERIKAALAGRGLPYPPIRHGGSRQGDVGRNFSDTRKARALLGWQASTSLADGIDRTLDWFLDRQGP